MASGSASEMQIAPPAAALTRLSARFRSRHLDEALARGTPPETTAPLALRARRLTTLCRRRAVADGLRCVTREAREARRGVPSSQARISPVLFQVAAASDELTRLAETLATPGPVAVRGVAQAWILLTDGTGPLYNAHSPANLRARAAGAANNLRLED